MHRYSLLATLLANSNFWHFASAASSGCGKSLPDGLTPGGVSLNTTIESASRINSTITRSFLSYLPQNFSASNDQAAPLILAFHGQSLPASSMERITNLSDPYFNTDYVVAYPAGIDIQWLSDPVAPPSSVLDDRIFATELLDYLTSNFCIDESRIYVTGVSNGGGLTGLLACDPAVNSRVAAFAGVAAAFYPDSALTEPLFQAGCNPELNGRKLPLLEMHGLNDSVIAYDGTSTNSLPITDWLNDWLERDGCADVTSTVDSQDGGNVTISSWTCDGSKDTVVHYKINNFGHGWPSTAYQGEPFETLRVGPTTFNATTDILAWFSQWTLAAYMEA